MKPPPRNGFIRLLNKRERTLLLMHAGEGEGCWSWLGGHNTEGYAVFHFMKERVSASRTAWCIANGCEWPANKIAMHSCDNPGCVNPSHIKPATDKENMEDRSMKGRQAHGEDQGNAKLTDAAVKEARELRAGGMSYGRIAKRFGVSKKTATSAVNGKTWKHVPLATPDLAQSTPCEPSRCSAVGVAGVTNRPNGPESEPHEKTRTSPRM